MYSTKHCGIITWYSVNKVESLITTCNRVKKEKSIGYILNETNMRVATQRAKPALTLLLYNINRVLNCLRSVLQTGCARGKRHALLRPPDVSHIGWTEVRAPSNFYLSLSFRPFYFFSYLRTTEPHDFAGFACITFLCYNFFPFKVKHKLRCMFFLLVFKLYCLNNYKVTFIIQFL